MFPLNLGALYLQRSLATPIQPINGVIPPNNTFAGYEHPLRHTLQTHCRLHQPPTDQYRDWFARLYGQTFINAFGTPATRNWQIPIAAAMGYYERLFAMLDEAISVGRYWTYTVAEAGNSVGWRLVAVTALGSIVAVQWHGVWCPWTEYFASDFRTDQPDTLNCRRAMLSVLTTMTYCLSAGRGLLRVPMATDRVQVTNRHGTEVRSNLTPANLELWGERNGYFERNLIR